MAVNKHKIDILQTLLIGEGDHGLDKMAIISLAEAAADPKRWLVTNWGIYVSDGKDDWQFVWNIPATIDPANPIMSLVKTRNNRVWRLIDTPYIMRRFSVIPSADQINIMVCCQLGRRPTHVSPVPLFNQLTRWNVTRGAFHGLGLLDSPPRWEERCDANTCCFMFNTVTEATTRLVNMPYAAIELAGCCLADGSFFVCGGVVEGMGSHVTNRGAIFSGGVWRSTRGVMLIGRHLHQCTLMGDGRVLVTGGLYGKDDQAEIYNPITDDFAQAGVMPLRGLHMHAAVLMPDDRILVCGGRHNNKQKQRGKAACIYDPACKGWFSAGKPYGGDAGTMIIRREREHTAVVINDPVEGECVLVVGGAVREAPNIYVESEMYVIAKDTWKLAPKYDSYKNDVVVRILQAADQQSGFAHQQVYNTVLFGY